MGKSRRLWLALAVLLLLLASGLVLFLLFYHPAQAMEFFYWNTTVVDFNEGRFYHTALSWRGDGEVQLLPVGFEHPWVPGNNTGLPPRGAPAAAVWNNHIYVIGGDNPYGNTHSEVFYTTIINTLTHELADWQETTPLPASAYPNGVFRHEATAMTFTETNRTYLYVFGGMYPGGGGETDYYDKVIYAEIRPDGTLGEWQETTPLPTPLYGMECLVLNGRIYILGGADQAGNSRPKVYYAVPDSSTGQIPEWRPTASLPALGTGGYVEASVAAEHGRIYVYGGAVSAVNPSYSPYVHFAAPDPATGEISGWTMATEVLPQNCYASEGAAYESGLLLAIAGAWNNAYDPSGDVRAALIEHDTGQTSEWFSTLGLTPRFWHAVVQDDFGWLYSIGGATGSAQGAPRLNEVWIASPYGEGRGFYQAAGGLIYPTQETTPTVYAPSGVYTSSIILVQLVEGQEASLTSLAWNTTITDPALMTVTVRYRYHHEGSWTSWHGPFLSRPGIGVTTPLTITGTCDWFQYSVRLETFSNTVTPFLNAVRIGILAPPNLTVKGLTVTGCDTCPTLVPPNEPVQVVFSVQNEGSSIPWGNNFYAMLFITTTSFTPWPPALPIGCENYPTETCPLIVPLYGQDFGEGAPSRTVSIPWTFTEPGVYHLVAYVDYNNTPAEPPPIYDVREYNEFDNSRERVVYVGNLTIYLPLVSKGWP